MLARFEQDGISYHALRTRQAGSRAFVSLHVLVPGAWTVQRGHDVAEEIEDALRARSRTPRSSPTSSPPRIRARSPTWASTG